MKRDPSASQARRRMIYERHQAGETLTAIAHDIGRSKARVGSLYHTACREIEGRDPVRDLIYDELVMLLEDDMSIMMVQRTYNVMMNESGTMPHPHIHHLARYTDEAWRAVPNAGVKTVRLIKRWLRYRGGKCA